MLRLLRSLLTITLLVLAVVAVYLWWESGTLLTTPANRLVGPPPPDLPAQDASFDGVRGWLIPSGRPGRCIVLMHGVGANRTSMIARARLFHRLDYSVLLFDFQAHGESPGNSITFGYREARNARAAVAYLRQHGGCTAVAALGQSMGGAAALEGGAPLPVDALVLESVYPTIEAATANRLQRRLGGRWARWLAPLLYVQLPLRLGVPVSALHPVEAIAHLRCPVFVIAGAADLSTTAAESRQLFEAAPSPKQFWLVPGAGHVDLYRYAGKDYERRVTDFLDRYLPRTALPPPGPSA